MNATHCATAGSTSGRHYSTIAAASLVLGIAGSMFWIHRQAQQELLALPTDERRILYNRTLETLRSVCARAEGSNLADYCSVQSQFLSRFPECDATCQDLCRRFAPRPTK